MRNNLVVGGYVVTAVKSTVMRRNPIKFETVKKSFPSNIWVLCEFLVPDLISAEHMPTEQSAHKRCTVTMNTTASYLRHTEQGKCGGGFCMFIHWFEGGLNIDYDTWQTRWRKKSIGVEEKKKSYEKITKGWGKLARS
jgi:hypothetical protein